MNVLVTGGAGYIGSHMVRELLREGHKVIVVDNLQAGHEDTLPKDVMFVHADIRERAEITQVLRAYNVGAIFHFASRIQVGESMTNPRIYFRDNLTATMELLESALDAKVLRFVFSSTAAVYGHPLRTPLDEDHPLQPVNTYGFTKLACERMLADYERAYGLRYVALRYFNACGADPAAGLSERHDPETHLIPLVLDAAAGKRPSLTVFGEDYPTPDGTCVRDYVHVMDLAEAHLAALNYLNAGGQSTAFNLGSGRGYSVREVIQAAERVSGRKVPITRGPRRPGDPPILVASPKRAHDAFGWAARRSSLEQILADAWAMHQRP